MDERDTRELLRRCRKHAKYLDDVGNDGDGQDVLDLVRICTELRGQVKAQLRQNETQRSALAVIHTWAHFDLEGSHYNPRALDARHVMNLCDKALKGEG
jgi:hypothetical protein